MCCFPFESLSRRTINYYLSYPGHGLTHLKRMIENVHWVRGSETECVAQGAWRVTGALLSNQVQ